MNNPDTYIVVNKGEVPDSDDSEFGSNFDWIVDRAKQRAESRTTPQVIYKLVPVMEVSIEVTIKVLTKDLTPAPDDRRDWDEADRIERERSK